MQNHILWSAQWFLVTVPGILFVGVLLKVPGFAPSLRFGGWMAASFPDWYAPLSRTVLMPCIPCLVVLVTLDMVLRPRRPASSPRYLMPVQFLQWFLMAPITLLFTPLPAVESQIRLARGKRLEYRVTEKA